MPHTDVDCTWILLPHDLAIALEITGEIPRIESAEVQRLNGLIISADITFVFGSGMTMRSKIGIDALHSERSVTAHGSSGTVTLAGGWEEELLVHYPDSPPLTRSIPTRGELPLLAELRAFVDHATGGPPPKSSAREGLEIVSVIEHLHEIAA
jgi:predicted dehydrogenase